MIYDNNDDLMEWYLGFCCSSSLISVLKGFSIGSGAGFDGIVAVFGDDPYENNPEYYTEFPEMIGFEGVGFFSEYFPEPEFVSYQVFYDTLKKEIKKYIIRKQKDDKYIDEVKYYLSLIRDRYNLVDKEDGLMNEEDELKGEL